MVGRILKLLWCISLCCGISTMSLTLLDSLSIGSPILLFRVEFTIEAMSSHPHSLITKECVVYDVVWQSSES